MNEEFPSAVPEMPVGDLSKAVSYYEKCSRAIDTR